MVTLKTLSCVAVSTAILVALPALTCSEGPEASTSRHVRRNRLGELRAADELGRRQARRPGHKRDARRVFEK
jgi:hypothetical protein